MEMVQPLVQNTHPDFDLGTNLSDGDRIQFFMVIRKIA
jgi:hypothetical protein